jgi:hypothetical protein
MGNTPWPALMMTFVVGLIPIILWWLRRHDSVAVQMRDTIALVDDMRRDLADLEDWAFTVRAKWNNQQRELQQSGVIDRAEDLPSMPELRMSRRRDTARTADTP